MEVTRNEFDILCDPTDNRRSQVSGPESGKWTTGHARLGSRPGAETMRLVHKDKEKIMKVATWNVRTLYQAGKLGNAVKEMKRLKIDVLGMSEIRWPGSGVVRADGAVMYYSGSAEQDPNHRHGVAVAIDESINKYVNNFVPYSERCAVLQLNGHPFNINIIQVYAPTADKSDEDVEEFYQQIQDIMRGTKNGDINIVMGDFNSKIGRGGFENIIGEYGLGERNERGDRLLQFCQERSLVVANTWFKLPPRRIYTWKSPQDGPEKIIRNQIDFIMINNRFRNAIKSAKTYPGADIGSDHNPLVAQLRVRLKKISRHNKSDRVNIDALKDKDKKLELCTQLNNNIKSLKEHIGNRGTDEIWSDLRDTAKETTLEILGKASRYKGKDWMTSEILQLMEDRRLQKNNKENYYGINRIIKREIKKAKEKWINEQCSEIETLERKHDSFHLHKKIKVMTHTYKRKTPAKLIDDNNKLVIDKPEELEVWRAYITECFSDFRETIDQFDSGLDGPEILKEELLKALKETKNGKATGPDDLCVEILKLLDDENISLLLKLFNRIYNTGEVPRQWLQSTFVTLPKKSNSKRCSEYRLISLMCHTLKVFLRILHSRLWRKIDENISETQFGFRNGLGTRDALFSVQVLTQKCLDQQRNVFACFIDYEKAFDNVRHDKLMSLLKQIGLDGRDIRIIKNLYWNQSAHIKIGSMTTSDIQILKGVRQGCILSPLLFNLYSESIFQEALEDLEVGIRVNGKPINNIRYADDTVLLASDEKELQCLVDRVNNVGLKYGLKINIKKTKFMVITKINIDHVRIRIEDQEIERVRRFKYLGCWLNDEWDPDEEIRSRIEIARSTFFKIKTLLCNRDLSLTTRWRATKCYVLSTLLYGVEGWTLKARTMSRLDSFEMWLYRRILKISWTERVTNDRVLERMDKEQELLTTVKRRKAAYFGHIFRNSKYSFLQLIVEGKIEGRRGVGRKRFSWLRNLRQWFDIREASTIIHLARDREEFQLMVANLR